MAQYTWKEVVGRCFDAFDAVTIEPAAVAEDEPALEAAVTVVRQSLEDPIDSPPLSERLAHAQRVTLVVPDATRSLGEEVVVGVLRHFADHLSENARLDVVIATGLHRAPSADELDRVPHLRALVDAGLTLQPHNPRAARPVPVEPNPITNPITGATVPVWLNPLVTDADLVVTLSRIELHQYAGFSGGYKPIAIGCAGTRTIGEIHGLPLLRSAGTRIGGLGGNPFQQMLCDVGCLAAPVFSVHEAPGDSGRAYVSGEPAAAQRLLISRPDANFWRDTDLFDMVVIHVDASKAINFYQASRAFTYLTLQDDPPLIPGAPVVLVASCEEGFGDGVGEQAFRDALSAGVRTLLRELAGEGPLHTPAGGRQRAYVLARALRRNPLHLVTNFDFDGDLPAGIEAYRRLDSALEAAAEEAPIAEEEEPSILVTRHVFDTLPRHVGDDTDLAEARGMD